MKTKRKTTINKELLKLSAEFLKHRLSAAGVSYIVTSKSKYRRNARIFVLLATATLMSYMTYKVVKEYLRYPKIVLKGDISYPKLIFPAVTVCTLSPVPRSTLEKTSVARNSKLREYLKTVEHERTEPELRVKCSLNPMCHWSFFGERCFCKASPCETEFCMDVTEEGCSCSPTMCTYNNSYLRELCVFVVKDGDKLCECKANVLHPESSETLSTSKDFYEVVKTLTDPELKDIINLVGESKLHDLIDIEDDLMPSSDDIYNYGTQFQDFVISCSYEGRKCGKENFTLYFHGEYGKCYIFNYVGDSTVSQQKALNIYNFGQTSGLNLIMNINSSEAGDLLSRELGARVVIHNPKELPLVAEYGFNIRDQDYTSVEVSPTATKSLGTPWGQCVKDGSHLPFKYSYLRYNQVCKKVCRRTYIRKICNCTKRNFLMGKVVEGIFESSSRACSSRNITESRCVQKVLRDIEDTRIDCKCHPPCNDQQYKTSLSTSTVNTDFFRMVKGVKTLRRDGEKTKNFDLSAKSTMMGLKVYYRTLQVESFEEVPSYSWETLIANIGGNLGFFMGLSIVTFAEICEFLLDVLLSLFRRNKIRDTPTSTVSNRDSFPQRLRISTPCRCATLESKMKEVEVKMREMFEVARSGYINGNHISVSPERKYSRCYRLRPTSVGRGRRIRRRTTSTSRERSLTLLPQNFLYSDFLVENSEVVLENRKCPHKY